MTYFVSEDTKISEKLIQLMSQSMDIMDQSAVSQSVSQSVLDRQTDFGQPASQPVSQSVLDRQTDFSQQVSQSVLDRQTDFYK